MLNLWILTGEASGGGGGGGGGVDHENYNFWSTSPTDDTYQIWLRLAQ